MVLVVESARHAVELSALRKDFSSNLQIRRSPPADRGGCAPKLRENETVAYFAIPSAGFLGGWPTARILRQHSGHEWV